MADQLKKALANHTESGGRGEVSLDQAEGVAIMLEKYQVVRDMFHAFDYMAVVTGPASKRMTGIAAAMEHILSLEDGKKRYVEAVTLLSRAFALAVPHDEALRMRDEVAFFQAVKAALSKSTPARPGKTKEELDAAIRQIVSKAVVSEEVVDIFSAVGLQKPDISILSDEFLEEVRELPHRSLAVELLQRLLNDEVKVRSTKNVVLARSFAERLEESIRRYQNRSIATAQVIAELIELAKDMRDAQRRGGADDRYS